MPRWIGRAPGGPNQGASNLAGVRVAKVAPNDRKRNRSTGPPSVSNAGTDEQHVCARRIRFKSSTSGGVPLVRASLLAGSVDFRPARPTVRQLFGHYDASRHDVLPAVAEHCRWDALGSAAVLQ